LISGKIIEELREVRQLGFRLKNQNPRLIEEMRIRFLPLSIPLKTSLFQFDQVSIILKFQSADIHNNNFPKNETYENPNPKFFVFRPDIYPWIEFRFIFPTNQHQTHSFPLGRKCR
jgi:hypothetical protein